MAGWGDKIKFQGWKWLWKLRLEVPGTQIYQYDPVPKWYGVSYVAVDRFVVVCHRIPLNLLIQLWRKVWAWLVIGFFPTKLDEILLRVEQVRGEIRKKGYDDGYLAGQAITEEQLRTFKIEIGKLKQEMTHA